MNPRPNVFESGGVWRGTEHRRDEAWLEAQLADVSTQLVPMWRLRNLIGGDDAPHAIFLARGDAAAMLAGADCIVFLGEVGGTQYFAVLVECDDPVDEFALPGRFEELQGVGALLGHQEGALLAYARGMAYWHSRHRFCGECGHPTQSAEAGHVRACTNSACGALHFPRTDPAIIVLVEHEGRCLLGRHARWPKGRYSVIAGFVEPGESLEDAVAREVMEETGIPVTEVRYHSSQPWPFPASIMLGFRARATDGAVRIDTDELEDARWFSRTELLAAVERGEVSLPSAISISRRLVDDWLAEQDNESYLRMANLPDWGSLRADK